MALDREVAARRQIRPVDAEVGEERVGGVAEDLQVAALVRVAVVVDPVGGDLGRVQRERPGEIVAVAHDAR